MIRVIDSKPKVSVIVPFFNRVELTLRAIKSVQNQTYSNIELIVVNDGSSDSDELVCELMHSIKNSIYIKLNKNKGPSKARNLGIEKSSGEYIAFLDSDDVWDESKLSTQIEIMLHNGWSFSHTSYYRHDAKKNKREKISSGRFHYTFPFLAFSCKIATPTVVIKTSLLGELNFNTQLRVGEDLLLWVELSKSETLHGIDTPLTTVYVGPATTARNRNLRNQALNNVARIGLSDHKIYKILHSCFRLVRKILWI